MMKKLLPILIFLISINYSRQDQTIKTTSDSFGIWKISYYVDEFGDRTDQGYIKNLKEINGTFSNSATTDSYLQVDFLIEFDKVSIKLFEYSRDHPVKGADINHSYSLSIKHNGKRINKKFSSRNYSDRAVFDKEESL